VLSHLGADVRALGAGELAALAGGPPVELADDGSRFVVSPKRR
jgi:hypothetical protein